MSSDRAEMPFWQHMDALRRVCVRSFIAVGFCFCITLYFHAELFLAFEGKLRQKSGPIQTYALLNAQISNTSDEAQTIALPLGAHILKSEGLLENQLAPKGFVAYSYPSPERLLVLSPLEGMICVVRVCFWTAVMLASPYWLLLMLQFLAPAFPSMQRAVFAFFLSTLIACLLGLSFAYFVTIPLGNEVLASFNTAIGQNAWTLDSYVSYCVLLLFANAFAFECGVVLLFLVHAGLISHSWMVAKRRHIVIAAFVVAALLTPPDVFTQFALAIPLLGLYELAILYARFRATATSA